jgi:hypothetical protein
MKKERMLLLPKSFIQSYTNDLETDEKLEIMSAIFNWYLENESKKIESKLVKILFDNVLPILETHKENYTNGRKGGAPEGNQNAKKTTKTTQETTKTTQETTKTTPLVLKNNPKEKEKEKEKDKDKIKDKDIDTEMQIVLNKFNLI